MTVPILGEQDFARMRGTAQVTKHLRLITPDHARAVGCYLLMLPVWLLAAVYGGYALDRAGLYPGAWLFFTLLALAIFLPLLPIFTARRHMRRPVLDALATLTGMEYASHDFEIKAMEAARPLLFGEDSTETFTDLLASKEGGNAWTICHAEIEAAGEPVFSGLLYWFARRGPTDAITALVPAAAAERVELPARFGRMPPTGDSAFDAAFAVFSSVPGDARGSFDQGFRALLLGYARAGPVYLYLARNNVLLAGGGPASFESPADAALRREPRLRAIFDNVRDAREVVRAVRARIDSA